MRKVIAVLSGILGVLLLVVGIAAAVVVGPDDVASLPESELDTGGAQVASTTAGLFAYTGATLHVTAQNAAGPVFVGAAHAIDVTSYFTDVARYQIDSFSYSGLTGSVLEGSLPVPAVAPADATFWRADASGEGVQSIDVELDGSPVALAVVPVTEPGALTLSIGLQLPGAFVAAVGVAVLGLVLLVLPIVLGRRRRRSAAQTAGGDDDAQGGVPAMAERPDGTERAVAPDTTGGAAQRSRVAVAVPVLALTGALLAGCSGIPAAAPLPEGPPTKTALTAKEAVAALADYDVRNNAAIALSGTTYDPSGWESADEGILLAEDLYSTQYAKANAEKPEVGARVSTVSEVFSPAFGGYPMYAVVTGGSTVDGAAPDTDAEGEVGVRVFERASAVAPWKQSLTARVAADALPDPAAPGVDSTPSEADETAALALLPALVTFLETGKAGSGLTPTPGMTELRTNVLKTGTGIESSSISAAPAATVKDQTGAGGSVRVVRTADGLLATYALDFSTTLRALPGFSINLDDPKVAKAIGLTGGTRTLVGRAVASVVVAIPDGGAPTVLAFRDQRVL